MVIKKERIKILALIILGAILLGYVGYIVYLYSRIKVLQSQNVEVMDQMRMLYELQKQVEFYSEDSNQTGFNQGANEDSYCSKETENFKIYAHNEEVCAEVAEDIEEVYQRIIEDLRYKIKPTKKIKIYIFKNNEEYHSKIRQPMWSVGRVIYNKNSFYSYEGVNLSGLIPHEITHLLLYNFMERQYEPVSMRWLSEGLATYEESKIVRSSLINNLRSKVALLKQGRQYSMQDLISSDVLKTRNTDLINLWYAQSFSMVEFMITQLGKAEFNEFCLNLKEYNDVEAALNKTYGNRFKTLDDFQQQWMEYIQKT
ncbi:MAG: peptidase MA family metallohydrolase [bacterium]|nr:peptidase MA family metallohydrolase [bacterium]MDD5756567.1 peptidase MA family metallohydrolase [bacterium]